MKRFAILLGAFTLTVSVFAQDEQRVLEEARRRAERPKREDSSSQRYEEEDRRTSEKSREDEDSIYLPIALSILPGSPIPGKVVDTTLGVGLIISNLRDVYGAQVSSVGSVAEGSVNGFQGAFVFNTADRGVSGMQAAYVFNTSDREVYGVQWAGVFNTSRGGGPVQVAGVFNVAEESFSGFQGAGVFNVVEKNLYGAQGAGVFNIVEGDVKGLQMAGLFNVAENLTGLQIGLVNVADTAVGFQLGLINIVRRGINDLGIWFEDSNYAYGFLQKGNSHFYTLTYLGAPRKDWFHSSDELAGGFGAGFRLGGNSLWQAAIDVDLSAKGRIDIKAIKEAVENEESYHPTIFPSLRASLRLPIGIGFAIHGGIIMDLECDQDLRVDDPFREDDDWSFDAFDLEWTVHPKLFLGISL